jgi:putative transposase
MKKHFTEEQIVSLLRAAEAKEVPARELCRKHGISEQTFYRWKSKYGGIDGSDVRRLKQLESENTKLKRILAEQMLVNDGLREIVKEKC